MKIRGWFIDGFGVFHNAKVENLPDGLTIFEGPNEAGKSTLLGFLRGVLFGFPKGNSSDPKYPPLRGGKHGGRVFLAADGREGEMVVTRYAGSKSSPTISRAGGGGGEADLADLLGRADKDVFQNIFAFSLGELESLDALRKLGVSEMVFSAGVTGAGRSARAVCDALDEQAGKLLASRSRNSRIMQLVGRLEELQAQCRLARDKSRDYSTLVQNQDKAAGEVRKLRDEQADLAAVASRMETLLELWPAWNKMQSLRSRLSELPAVDEFPPDGERRLVLAETAVDTAAEKLRELQDVLKRKENARLDLREKLNDLLLPCGDAVEVQFSNLKLYQEWLNQRPRMEQAVLHRHQSLEETLRDLGTGWTQRQVVAVDTSVARQAEVRQWKQRLADAEAMRNEASRDQVAAATALKVAREEHDRLSRRLVAPEMDERTLVAREDSLARLNSLMSSLKLRQARLEALRQGAAQRGGDVVSPPMVRGVYILSGLVAAMGVAFSAYLFATGKPLAGGVIATVFVLLAVAVAIVGRRIVGNVTGESAVSDAAAKTREEIARLESESAGEALNVAAVAGELGLSAMPTDLNIASCTGRLRDLQKSLLSWQMEGSRLAELKEKLAEADSQSRENADRADLAGATRETVIAQWKDWKRQAGLPDSLDADGVLAFLSKAESARTQVRDLRDAREELEQLRRQISSWLADSSALLSRAGRVPAEGAGEREIAESLAGLYRDCTEDRQRRQSLLALDKEITSLQADVESARQRLAELRQRMEDILKEAGATDGDAFRGKLEVYKERRGIKDSIEAQELAISTRLGQGDDARAMREELASGHVAQWEETRQSAQRELERTRQAFEDAIRAEDAAVKARQAMEKSVEVPRLELEAESLRSELAAAVNEWQTKTVARALVDCTLQRFVRTRQPEVLAQAGKALCDVTGGAYAGIEQTVDGEVGFEVMDASRGRKSPSQLSRGTAEQLYICLRLGLAAEFARKRTSLPMVMDDVLVNFDPVRARAMAGVIAEFAASHQVLLFTCHPQTVELFRSVCPGVRVERLGEL